MAQISVLVLDLCIAMRESFCSSSTCIPCSSLYSLFHLCAQSNKILNLKEYNKMPSLKGSFGEGGVGAVLVCVPHKLQSKLSHVIDFLKDMTASVAALMTKVGGRS